MTSRSLKRLLCAAGSAALAAQFSFAGGAGAAVTDFNALHWRLLGPFRGGWATMVEGVPSQPDTFYFTAAGGGLWRTRNAGRTWASLFDKGGAASVGALAVAPSDPNTLYIGTGQPEPRYDVTAGQGVYKSIDGGATWKSLGLQATRYIGRIWVNPTDPNIVLVGAQGHFFGPSADRGVYRSTDGGRTWAHTLAIDSRTGVSDLASDPNNPNVIYAAAWEARQYPWLSYFAPVEGSGSAIYKSTDGGVSWTRLSGGGWPAGPLGRISLAVADTSRGVRVYATVDSDKSGGLYRSDDGGANWTRVNKGDAFKSWYASRLTVEPNDPDVIYTVGQAIRRCDHGGENCEVTRGSPGGDDYHHIWINPSHPDHIAAASDQGAVVSVDGGKTWSDWYNQPTAQLYHLATDNRFPYRIYSGQQDSGTVSILSRSDYGAISFRDWNPVGGDERDYDIPDPTDPDIVYGSGLGGRVSKWDAHTGQVQNISPWPVSSYGQRPTLTRFHYNWVTPLVSSRTGTPAIYLGAQMLLRSTDRGKTWTALGGDLTGKTADAQRCDGDIALADARPCGYGTITAIEPSPRHADEIWVGTDDGLIQLTRDGGAHWTNVTPPNLPAWAKVSTLDVSTLKDGTAYAAIDNQRLDDFQPHVLRTHDYGATWQPATEGLPADHFISVVRADPVQPGLLYAGSDAGAFVSFDDGDHWGPLQQNLPTAWVHDLLVHGDDLVAATQGRSIWILDDVTPLRQIAAGGGGDEPRLFTPQTAMRVHPDNNTDTPPPPETALGENPPPGAIIDYVLPADVQGPVTLEVRDADGRLVRRFSSADQPEAPDAELYFDKAWTRPAPVLQATPGLHRFVWNLRWPRPRAVKYQYTIAGVWNRGAPIVPEGPWALPGDYKLVLHVDGKDYAQPLKVVEDPRIPVTRAELESSLALSQRISQALARARQGYGEMQSVGEQLDRIGEAAVAPHPAKAAKASSLPDQTRAAAEDLRRTPPNGELSFDVIDGQLGAVEADLEAADVAPTQAQREVVDGAVAALDRAWKRWSAFKSGDLASIDAALVKQGRKAITIPSPDEMKVEAPDPGEDLP